MEMEGVLNSEDSNKFYTGIQSLACFMLLLNTLLPYAENMNYCQTEKTGFKEVEFVLVQIRLTLELTDRHLPDIFSGGLSNIQAL